MKECDICTRYEDWILELMEEEVLDPYHDWNNEPDYENVVNMDLEIRVDVLNDIIIHKIKMKKSDKSNPIYLIKLVDNLIKRCEMNERSDLIDKLHSMKCSLEGI